MNANELMIGNYVNYQGRAQKICALNMNSVKIGELAYDDHRETLSNDSIKPISLTEEWLLKFGFIHNKSVNEDGELLINNYTLKIDKYSTIVIEDDFSFGIENEIESVIFDNDVLKSVHRLQNLYFALTNKELTIN